MNKNISREITALTQNDCFTIFSKLKKEFNFPLHYHEEFELSNKGILFSQETIRAIYPSIETLNQKSGFDSVITIINILHNLSISRNLKILSGYGFNNDMPFNFNSRRIENIFEYKNKNYD